MYYLNDESFDDVEEYLMLFFLYRSGGLYQFSRLSMDA